MFNISGEYGRRRTHRARSELRHRNRSNVMTRPVPSRDEPSDDDRPDPSAYFTPVGREIYCSTPCRKAAFRRRDQGPTAALAIPGAWPRRDYCIYECPDCGERFYGQQR